MNAKVNGTTLTITSSAKVAEIEKLAKSDPDALQLFEEKDNKKIPTFLVSAKVGGIPQVGPFGIVFNGKTYEGGYATVTVGLPDFDTAEAAKEYVADKYGAALKNLCQWEPQVPGKLEQLANERAMILDLIEF